jgi:hypothetical protein
MGTGTGIGIAGSGKTGSGIMMGTDFVFELWCNL